MEKRGPSQALAVAVGFLSSLMLALVSLRIIFGTNTFKRPVNWLWLIKCVKTH